MVKLLLLFTIVPLLELYLLLRLDELIGLWPTVGIVLTTGLVGAWLARSEGLRVLRRWQASLVRGTVPEEGVLAGVLILVGGVLLVTPGILTDLTGFLLLLPPSRRVIARAIHRRLEQRLKDGTFKVVRLSDLQDRSTFVYPRGQAGPSNVVMDVEGEEVEPDDEAPERPRVLH